MAPIPESDDELLDIYEGKVPLPPGWVRGKHAARFAAAAKAAALDLSTSDEKTSGLNGAAQDAEQQAKLRAFCARVGQEWLPWADSHTLPIWAAKPGVVCLAGSGTLFRVADVSFLVTAAHVYTDAEDGGWTLLVTDDSDGAPEVRLTGGAVWVQPLPLDVAVWELSPAVVNSLTGRAFLSVHDTDRRRRRTGPGLYALYGYPGELCDLSSRVGARVIAEHRPLSYITSPYSGQVHHHGSYDPNFHFCLRLSTSNSGLLGQQSDMPSKLYGISGCSLWQVYAEGMSVNLWSFRQSVVVAVQTHVNYDLGYIRGTRWWVIERIIRDNWPELAPALSLEMPDPRPAAV